MKTFPFNLKIGAFDKFTSTFANLSNKMDRLGKRAKKLGKNISIGISGPLAGIGILSVKSLSDIEQMTVALEGMAGGAEKAKKLMDELMDFSANTPFQLEGISDAARMLLATEKISTDQIKEALTVAGDIAAGSKAQISDIAYVMSKAASKGKADMEILNMLLERGIPIMGSLERETGKHGASLSKMVSKGKITYKILYESMKKLREEGGVFENMMQKQSLTIKGLLSTLKDNFTLSTAAIGDSIIKTTKFQERITYLTEKIQIFTKIFKKLPPNMQEFLVWAGLAAIALGPLINGVGQLIIGMGVMVALAPQIAAGFAVILAAWPFAIIAAGVATLAVFMADLVEKTGSLGNALKITGAVFKDAILYPFQRLADLVTYVWGLLGEPPAGLKRFSEFSFGEKAANEIVNPSEFGRSQSAAQARAAIRGQRELYDIQQRAMKGDKAAIEILFKNPPPGMRTSVKSETNANVTVDQGISMNGE